MTTDPRDRLLDLLAARATEGLSPVDTAELVGLLAAFPDVDPDTFDLAAAAADLALSPPPRPAPPHLMARLEREVAVYFAATRPAPAAPRRRPVWTRLGWPVAAGLAGVLLWTQLGRPQPPTAAARLALLRAEPTATAFAGTAPTASGEIVWSNAKQEGYLEVRGLPPLDPTKEQYQLWVVDGGRTDPEPVDGGVFDVAPTGPTLVPVKNPIRVRDAKAFAVTKEPAGGVVVSKGPHLLVLTPKGS